MQDDPANDLTLPPEASSVTLLLLDDPGAAEAVRQVLQDRLPTLQVLSTESLSEARALLREAPVDLVLTGHELTEGSSLDLLAARDEVAPDVPVVVQADAERAETVVAVMKAGASDYVYRDAEGDYLGRLPGVLVGVLRRDRQVRQDAVARLHRQQEEWWDRVRAMLAYVSHEIKNPLSIISGNAQLLIELGRMTNLDDDLFHPIQDIEEASRRVTESLSKLNELRSLSAADIRQREERMFRLK